MESDSDGFVAKIKAELKSMLALEPVYQHFLKRPKVSECRLKKEGTVCEVLS